ncbi:hypothetical protein F4860DRAFT_511076 [Xylaria cubensis]|nr:hypothetical protein F4860DRAFT_511076 [Xylaria cubensis]
MDSEILDWLSHLDPNSRPKSESIVWPPTPRTRGYYFQLKRKAELEAEQQLNQPCAVAKLDFNHSATMPVSKRSSKKKAASERDDEHQQDDQKGRKDNLEQTADREARYRRRAKTEPPISAAEGAGSVPSDSEAEHQAEVAQTRAGTDGPAEQPRVGVNNFASFTSTTKSLQRLSIITKPPPLSSLSSPPPNNPPPSNAGSAYPGLQSAKGQGPTRSKSPMKKPRDLKKLQKLVKWVNVMPIDLTKKEYGQFAKLYQSVQNALGKGFLPMELYATLNSKLNLNGESDSLFAERPTRPITPDDLTMPRDDQRSSFDASLPVQEDEKSKLLDRIHVQSLITEYRDLRAIQA